MLANRVDSARRGRLASQPCLGAVARHAERDARRYAGNRLIREGLVEYDQRNRPEALTLFERARAMQPSARTLRAIGNVAFEMRKYTKSIDAPARVAVRQSQARVYVYWAVTPRLP